MSVSSSRNRSGVGKALQHRVAMGIDRLRPMARSDGGDIELVEVDSEGTVHVRLHGTCVGCPSSAVTLSLGIERYLKSQIPEITGVVCE